MILYHGGYSEIITPEIREAKHNKDFGQGFYCTQIREQAERWAARFPNPVVSVFEYTKNDSLNILRFDEMNDEWLDFIAGCRNGKQHNYDIVIGSMANDQVWSYVADYFSGVLTKEQFWVLAKFKRPTHQIAFCSFRSLLYLKFVKGYEVSL
jgi:hypothetical protein